jgi:hypothetical protein
VRKQRGDKPFVRVHPVTITTEHAERGYDHAEEVREAQQHATITPSVTITSPAPATARAAAPNTAQQPAPAAAPQNTGPALDPNMEISGEPVVEGPDMSDMFAAQIQDPAARERMQAAARARKAGRGRQQQTEVVYVPGQPGPAPGPQGQQVAPSPEAGGVIQDPIIATILDLAQKGMAYFDNAQRLKMAALNPPAPTFTDIIGQRTIAVFADQLARAQGKATGVALGKDTVMGADAIASTSMASVLQEKMKEHDDAFEKRLKEQEATIAKLIGGSVVQQAAAATTTPAPKPTIDEGSEHVPV